VGGAVVVVVVGFAVVVGAAVVVVVCFTVVVGRSEVVVARSFRAATRSASGPSPLPRPMITAPNTTVASAVAPTFAARECGLVHRTTIATGQQTRRSGTIVHQVWYQLTECEGRAPARYADEGPTPPVPGGGCKPTG